MTYATVTTVTIENDATPNVQSKITFASDDEVKAATLLADAVYYFFDRHNPADLGLSDDAFDTAEEKLNALCGALHGATHPSRR